MAKGDAHAGEMPDAASMATADTPLETKGLKEGSLGLFANAMIGVATVAPAVGLALTLGPLADVVGSKTPSILILGFLPMLMIVFAFDRLNRADPDCGASFSWATRAFGGYLGWVVGFVILAGAVIVMANLAQLMGESALYLVGLDGAAQSGFWVAVVGVGWLGVVTVIATLGGIDGSKTVQYILMALQMGSLAVFVVVAIIGAYVRRPEGFEPISISWFVPTGLTVSQLAAAVLLALFIYWGWDVCLNVNEESADAQRIPGLGALLSTLTLLVTFVVVAVACITYSGPAFMAENYGDALSAVAREALGSPLDKLLLLALVTASAASVVSCILANSRLSLSMAAHRAFPKAFGRVSRRYMVPVVGTVVWGVLGAVWFVAAKAIDSSVIYDAILGTAFTIAFYYGATGIACAVYYRHYLLKSWRNFLFMGLLPSVGAAVMGAAFVRSAFDYWDPAMAYSGGVFGIGMPVVIGIGTIVAAAVLAGVARVFKPQFFRDRRPETWPGENEPLPFSDETVV